MSVQMLVWNRVVDPARFRKVLDAGAKDQQRSGLTLKALWQDADDDHMIWFLLDVADREQAQAFVDAPESARTGEEAGVVDGGYHWLEKI